MKARLQPEGLESAQEVGRLRTVVVYDDFDQPILVVQKMDQGQILTTQANDPNFKKILSSLGIGLNAVYKAVGK